MSGLGRAGIFSKKKIGVPANSQQAPISVNKFRINRAQVKTVLKNVASSDNFFGKCGRSEEFGRAKIFRIVYRVGIKKFRTSGGRAFLLKFRAQDGREEIGYAHTPPILVMIKHKL